MGHNNCACINRKDTEIEVQKGSKGKTNQAWKNKAAFDKIQDCLSETN